MPLSLSWLTIRNKEETSVYHEIPSCSWQLKESDKVSIVKDKIWDAGISYPAKAD